MVQAVTANAPPWVSLIVIDTTDVVAASRWLVRIPTHTSWMSPASFRAAARQHGKTTMKDEPRKVLTRAPEAG